LWPGSLRKKGESEKKRLSLLKFTAMTFDNSKTIIGFRIRLFFVTIIALAWIAVVYLIKMIKFPLLGIDDGIWTLLVVIIWIVVAFMPMIRNYQFVFFSDDGESIIFRYFNAGIVGGKKNSVEINKRTFTGYKSESKFFGLSRSIILFQKLGQGTAKYPPVHITALTREQRAKVFHTLDIYAKKSEPYSSII
jgi:hypothetical protein